MTLSLDFFKRRKLVVGDVFSFFHLVGGGGGSKQTSRKLVCAPAHPKYLLLFQIKCIYADSYFNHAKCQF